MPVNQKEYTPYCYYIKWSSANLSYYGVRRAKKDKCLYESGCHPDELWRTYFTSSVYVQEAREKYGEPDIIQVRRTFIDGRKAQKWEEEVLRRLNAINRDDWLNKNVSGYNGWDAESRKKLSESCKGRVYGSETKLKQSLAKKGKIGGVHSNPVKFIWNDREYEFVSLTDFLNTFTRSSVSIYRRLTKNAGSWITLTRVKDSSKHPFSNGDRLFLSWK